MSVLSTDFEQGNHVRRMRDELKWIAGKVLEDQLNVRVLPQLHKIIWGEVRGV